VCAGYKEFAPYFAAAEKGGAEAEGALRACVAALKQRTRKYAKVQTSWIHRHFRSAPPQPVLRARAMD
jgi:tRNA A37 N6-isopentenylltransferase MiaA